MGTGQDGRAAANAFVRLDAWLDTMRGPAGYSGPVVHWWRHSLIYVGAGLDWRYEGIIAGYLAMWESTEDRHWLDKARRAGDDLLGGQLENGHFSASAFEMNPASGGTPHEAACDVALLQLARALRRQGEAEWQRYARSAELNVKLYYVQQLWDAETRSFSDGRRTPSFVPNKAATASEAMFLLAETSGDASWVERYALPTLDRIVDHQAQSGGLLDGAIAQNSLGSVRIEAYLPVYIARCIPALLYGHRWTNAARYADCALRAMRFLGRWTGEDGTLPAAVYPNGRVSRSPSWIAPLGDVLRAADLMLPYGFDCDLDAMRHRLLSGQDRSGGIQTASGFAAQSGGQPPPVPDVLDVLHVTGWCDKAFRYLATRTAGPLPRSAPVPSFETVCSFRGRKMRLVETQHELVVSSAGGIRYHWLKGAPWPQHAAPEFWLG